MDLNTPTAAAEFPEQDLELARLRALPALSSLANSSIFVTGGTGFVGRWLLALLIYADRANSLGLTVTVLTRDADRFRSRYPALANAPSVSLLQGDTRALPPSDRSFSHVIHGAAELSPNNDESEIVAAQQLLDFSRAAGAKRILFLSSGAVYDPNASPVAESAPLAQAPSAYARAKMRCEQLLAEGCAKSGQQLVTCRIFALVGPGLPLDAHFAIGNFILDAVSGRDITVASDGSAVRSYLYASDLAAWLIMMLAHGSSGAAYNAGGSRAISIADLARLVAATVPGAGSCRIQSGNSDRAFYVPCVTLAHRELGLEPWTSLEESIYKTAAWARSKALP